MDQVWEAWESLAQGQANFFATMEWNRLWLGHWRSEAALLFFLLQQDGRPVGLFPLVLVNEIQRGLRRRKLELLATPHQPEWLIDGPAEPIVSRWLDELASVGGWDVLRLGAVRSDMPGLTEMKSRLRDKGFKWREEKLGGAPITAVDGDFDEYWASRSANLRKKLGKMWRHAERQGRLEFSASRAEDDPETWTRRLMAVAEKSWKVDQGSSLAQGADRIFYPEAIRFFLPRGQARIFMLSLGDLDIAYYLGFIRAGTFFNLKTDYRSDFADLSPGIVLLKPLMEHCFADPAITRVNFMAALPFNVRWATDSQPLSDVTVAGRGLRARAIWLGGKLRRGFLADHKAEETPLD
jgi:CelD/BcsL family acetyltransferase involved in cellulose biosynthesis